MTAKKEFNLVGVDAPVVDIKSPGARHSPVVDVLHSVKDFHLRKNQSFPEKRRKKCLAWRQGFSTENNIFLFLVLEKNQFVFNTWDDRDTYSQAILGGGDGVEFSVVVEPSHRTHLKKHVKKKHENLTWCYVEITQLDEEVKRSEYSRTPSMTDRCIICVTNCHQVHSHFLWMGNFHLYFKKTFGSRSSSGAVRICFRIWVRRL